MRIDILTIFPEMFDGILSASMLGRASANGILEFHAHNIRDYSLNKHHNTDDYPYGGGAGMVMLAQPIMDCIDAVTALSEAKPRRIVMTPRGKTLTPELAMELAKEERLLILAGHYEGIDERVMELMDEEISIGDYVLTGGELPALIVADAVARMCEGVLPSEECFEEESHYGGLLEYPHYTRPEIWHGQAVPDVLMSGHHKNIAAYRLEKSIEITGERRPDMLADYNALHKNDKRKKKR